eukprot:g2811.t1
MKREASGRHKRRLSLIGADGAPKPRRSSQIALTLQESIHLAAPAAQLGLLMTALASHQAVIRPLLAQDLVFDEEAAAAAGKLGDASAPTTLDPATQLDPELASWALSAMNEFCAGSQDNRAAVAAQNGATVIMDLVQFYCNDLYVQWQGCYSLAALASDRAHALTFGPAGIDAVLGCMARTDLSELAAAGCRALNALCHFGTPAEEGGPASDLVAHALASGVLDLMPRMLGQFKSDFQFQFRGQELLKKFQAAAAAGAGVGAGAAAAPAPAAAAATDAAPEAAAATAAETAAAPAS